MNGYEPKYDPEGRMVWPLAGKILTADFDGGVTPDRMALVVETRQGPVGAWPVVVMKLDDWNAMWAELIRLRQEAQDR